MVSPLVVHLVVILLPAVLSQDCSVPQQIVDCGYVGINQTGCENRGCCWKPNLTPAVWCYYKAEIVPQYIIDSIVNTPLGVKITVKTNSSTSTRHGVPISPLVVEISAQTDTRLHIKIYDPNNERWEIPDSVSPAPTDPDALPSNVLYTYSYPDKGNEFALTVKRGDETIFDVSNLIFYDQYISLTNKLPVNNYIYGIGEHVTPYLRLKPNTYTLWTYDTPTPQYLNLYGAHPFYMEMRPDSGNAHGVYLRNSNGMDVILKDTSLTYNIIGGILDYYVFMGPQPEGVVQQYQGVIGRPYFPPYWSLGYHQCRYGYPNIEYLENVVAQFIEKKIPLDTIWSDIDYMDGYRDFTLDPVNYPQQKVHSFVKKLHKEGRQYVHIVDPGIKIEKGYPAYDNGMDLDLFIKDKDGNVFTGKVWPGITAFPDFLHPKSHQYWEENIKYFHTHLAPVDGLWIDMNEVSNFCIGECNSTLLMDNTIEKRKPPKYDTPYSNVHKSAYVPTEYKGFDPNNPSYAIDNQGNHNSLDDHAISPDATHYGNILEYNVHNMYGLTETIATRLALENIRKKRSLVISRSTFPSSGSHGGHWTGDNHASWLDMYQSIPDVLNFQMFSVPLVGADICGFKDVTTEELCGRWMQLGAFYPFSRNHNGASNNPQEPYVWDSVTEMSRKALHIRYSILPYYYTLFYKAHREPDPNNPSAVVLKPLFFEFPNDFNTYEIDKQFMIGNSILITPILEQGAVSVDAYFPSGIWYDYYTLTVETSGTQGKNKELKATNDIPIHIRGGSVIPMHGPGMTTAESRSTPLSLLVALDERGIASGDMYYDDGESLLMNNYIFINYQVVNSELKSSVTGPGYSDVSLLDTVTVIGLDTEPTAVTVNGESINSFNYQDKRLIMNNLAVNVTSEFNIKWSS